MGKKNYNMNCRRTYATLVVGHDFADPDNITRLLEIRPDDIVRAGEYVTKTRKAVCSVWSISTRDVKKLSKSRDAQEHINWLLNKVKNKKAQLRRLRSSGYRLDLSCLWDMSWPTGGPGLDSKFIKKLSGYPFDLGFDIWFPYKFGKGR